MKKKDLQKYKKILLEEKKQIIERALQLADRNVTVDLDDIPDLMDLATTDLNQRLSIEIKERERNLLGKIEHALERIEDGSFGVCEECGGEINIKRIEARPVTTMCIKCKEEQEEREKRERLSRPDDFRYSAKIPLGGGSGD
ncbi:MAG: TraR/DksA family transcriptional regulator [Candidatus Omnitrophota bacterium]